MHEDLQNIITRPRDLPIVFGLMITIDCISFFCGLIHDTGFPYDHAIHYI